MVSVVRSLFSFTTGSNRGNCSLCLFPVFYSTASVFTQLLERKEVYSIGSCHFRLHSPCQLSPVQVEVKHRHWCRHSSSDLHQPPCRSSDKGSLLQVINPSKPWTGRPRRGVGALRPTGRSVTPSECARVSGRHRAPGIALATPRRDLSTLADEHQV